MPVFIKAGTILPFGPPAQYSSEKPWDELEIVSILVLMVPRSMSDEGDNYNYEKGTGNPVCLE